MVNWKENGKDLLKGAGIAAVVVGAWKGGPELRDLIVQYSNGLDVCDVGRWGKSGLNFVGETIRYGLPVIAPWLSYKFSKKL